MKLLVMNALSVVLRKASNQNIQNKLNIKEM